MDALPQLSLADRSEILSRLLQLEAAEGGIPEASADEKQLLDKELEDYLSKSEPASPWHAAEGRLRRSQ